MESDKTIETRRKAQRNGEEDPIVVAQRFLNIYRQIHVFSNEKKASFNKMLMELSPEIRGMFGNLPGGTLLQEYVDELAEQYGVEKSVQTNEVKIDDEDSKQARILATALAEAQVQAAGRIQSGAPVNIPMMTNAPATEAKLSMDKNFAQEFASALSTALSQNTQGVDKELKSIIANLGRTQMEMIKILKEGKTSSNTFATSQTPQKSSAQQSSYFPDFDTASVSSSENPQIIQQLIDGQQQILDRLNQVENNSTGITATSSNINLEKLISNLYENQKKDSMKMAQTIAESQNKLAKAIVQNNTLNQNSSNIQINSTDYSGVLANIADKLGKMSNASQKIEVKFPMQPFNALINTQSAIYREIANAQNKERSTIITELLKANRLYLQSIANTLKAQPIVVPPSINNSVDDYVVSETSIYPYADEDMTDDDFEEFNFVNSESSKKKKKKKKNKPSDNINNNEKMTIADTLVSTISKGFDLLKHKEEISKNISLENPAYEQPTEQTNIESKKDQYNDVYKIEETPSVVEEQTLPIVEEIIDTPISAASTIEEIQPTTDSDIISDDTIKEETQAPSEENKSIEEVDIPSFSVADDLGFDVPLSFEETDTADDWGFGNTNDANDEIESNTTQSWNFNSEEDDDEKQIDDEEWEWEYVEDDNSISSDDDQEWEYVEVDPDSDLSDDEEWEYVEVDPENTTNNFFTEGAEFNDNNVDESATESLTEELDIKENIDTSEQEIAEFTPDEQPVTFEDEDNYNNEIVETTLK